MCVQHHILSLVFLITCAVVARAQCQGKVKTLYADTKLKVFASPNFPRRYPSKVYCQWLIAAPSHDYKLRVDTIALNLETTLDCLYDSVSLYNGNSKQSTLIQRLCMGHFTIYSSGRFMLVIFTSDDSVEGRGFQFRYFAIRKNPTTFPTTSGPAESTTQQPKKNNSWLNTGALVGGVVGGVSFVIILGIICGRCLGSGGPHQPPVHRPAAYYHSHAPPVTPLHASGDAPTISTAVHMVQNNNSVFMVSQALDHNVSRSRIASHMNGGATNMAFDGSGDIASGIAGLGAAAAMGMVPPPIGVPPPTYDDTMLMTNPPAIPPSPRRASFAPLHNSTDGSLAPPPLYTPRDPGTYTPATLQPGPSTSTGMPAGVPPQHAPFAPQTECPGAHLLPQELVPTTSLRTSASAPQPSEPTLTSTGGTTSERSWAYAFEYSGSTDSCSTPTDSTVLTSPSMTLSDLGSPLQELPAEDEGACSSDPAWQQAGSAVNPPQDSMSAGWPGESSHFSDPPPCANQANEDIDDFVPDFPTIDILGPDMTEAQLGVHEEEILAPNVPAATVSHREPRVTENQSLPVEPGEMSQSDNCQGTSPLQDATSTVASAAVPSDTGVGSGILTPGIFVTAQDEDQSASAEQDPVNDETSMNPALISEEASAETTTEPTVPSEAFSSQALTQPAEFSDEASDGSSTQQPVACESPPDLASSPEVLSHQWAERTASASSLPPPPSPYATIVSDSDTENFPPPPSPLNADSDDELQTPRMDSPVLASSPTPSVSDPYVKPTAESFAQSPAEFVSNDSRNSQEHQYVTDSFHRQGADSPNLSPTPDFPLSPTPDSPVCLVVECPTLPRTDSPPCPATEALAPHGGESSVCPPVAETQVFSEKHCPVSGLTDSQNHSRPDSAPSPTAELATEPPILFSAEQNLPESYEDEDIGCVREATGGEELYGTPSLSSQSSPMLTERQLRNSTSFPDIAGQVEVIRKEAFQRADSH